MGNGTRSSAGRRGGGPGRLPTHRLVLAMALLSTAPPLVIHEGWRGVLVAVAAVFYAAYLLLGKRWPRLRRRRVAPPRPGPLPVPSATQAPAPPALQPPTTPLSRSDAPAAAHPLSTPTAQPPTTPAPPLESAADRADESAPEH
ncbi:hypothetical protein JIG36_03610 [Actinoplanes sp. LDG1-06]|uniref:Uncharacterized protein n=1 Tax=Paractinoplanes ovalisporus TaxID=2810368 RepID=A0ABS2A455_9ACTN|nr:hypothetical protein [Actinoplanes ovalisporus]MBM2614641.1 hypothetical protein [Actinoplanes ovalisporus]